MMLKVISWVKENGYQWHVEALMERGCEESMAYGMVYDMYHMDRDEFKVKYSGK